MGAEEVHANGRSLVQLERLLESLRAAEFDINSGIAELVDNSVEADAKNIWVSTKTEKIAAGGSKAVEVISGIAVVDDGCGMDAAVLNGGLVLGDTNRPPRPGGGRGIGKFGVGLTMGAISLARRVEVYSRQLADAPMSFTYLDLDEVGAGTQREIPYPVSKDPAPEYLELLSGSSGTIVVLSKCDRLRHDPSQEAKAIPASELMAGVPHFLGRTFRKFIDAGIRFWFEGNPIYLHDPLYLMGPTRFDAKNPKQPDLKAAEWGKIVSIPLEVPGEPDKKANVTIRMSLLPKEWRQAPGSGGGSFARERKIDENEGISILRANREVLYHRVPYLIGVRGQSTYLDIDRWWGCEISFPPELDPYFHVRFIKRGAEPVGSVRDRIREEIWASVKDLRRQIQRDFHQSAAEKEAERGAFTESEEAMAEAAKVLPRGHQGDTKDPEEVAAEIDRAVEDEAESEAGGRRSREERRQEIEARPYSIVPVRWPETMFFEPIHQPGRIILQLNVNHPFYKEILQPLMGDGSADDLGADQAGDTLDQRRLRRAFSLMLLSFAHAEAFFTQPDQQSLLETLRMQWGTALRVALTKASDRG